MHLLLALLNSRGLRPRILAAALSSIVVVLASLVSAAPGSVPHLPAAPPLAPYRNGPLLFSPTNVPGFGYSATTVGDVNNDGYSDIAVTTSYVDSSGLYVAYLFLGGAAGLATTPAWETHSLPHPMKVAAAGDVNNDGYDDVLFYYDGGIEVRYGSATLLHAVADFSATAPGDFGTAAQTAGDVNGDGYADIVVGQWAGGYEKIYVYRGSSTGLHAADVQALSNPGAASNGFGVAVAGIGDANGDGYADVAVGAPYVGGGSAFVYWGSATSLANVPQTISNFGPIAVNFGLTIAPAGDMNGDGYADLMIGDPNLSETFPGSLTGAAEVLAGSATGMADALSVGLSPYSYESFGGDVFSAGDLNGDGYCDALESSTGIYSGAGGFHIVMGHPTYQESYLSTGPTTYGTSGNLTARPAGDVNGDGFADFLLAVPDMRTVFVFYGKSVGLKSEHVATRFGGQSSGLLGWSIAVGDVNADGYADVVVGMPWHNVGASAQNGEVQLYLGSATGIPATPSWSWEGPDAGGQLGISVAAGGDINGDGYGDIVAGAHVGEKAWVIYGRADWTGATPAYALSIGSTSSYFGGCVAFAGDVNGDGFADVLVGANNFNQPGAIQAGKVTLFMGGASSATLSSWAPAPTQAAAHEGTWVASAGDVNGDGFSDIVTGTGSFDDNTVVDAGHVQLFMGGVNGPSSTPAREWRGEGPGEFFGNTVCGIGDFNGDGHADIAVGAYGHPPGGRVYIYRGTASNVEAAPGWVINGTQAGEAFGNVIAPAGDANKDGLADLVVGSVFWDGVGGQDVGKATLYLGTTLGTVTGFPPLEGSAAFDNLGACVAGGDVNGDGLGDMVSGAPRAQNSLYQEGSFRLFLTTAMPVYSQATVPAGKPSPAHLTLPGFAGSPLASLDKGPSATQMGVTRAAYSVGGRDRVRLEWQLRDSPLTAAVRGYTFNWYPTPAPTDHGGSIQYSDAMSALTASRAYGWRLRTDTRSPYFRYGPWIGPSTNPPGQWDFRTAGAAATVGSPVREPSGVALLPIAPDPARSRTTLAFELPSRMNARLEVRDVAGRRVRVLEDGVMDGGRHTFSWNCSDDRGRACPPGLYFIELSAASARSQQRVVIVR